MTLFLALLLAAQTPEGVRAPRCERLYQEGRRLYFDGRFERGPWELRRRAGRARGEEGSPDDTLSQRYEGLCFQYEDRLDEALVLFRAAAETLLAQERARTAASCRRLTPAWPTPSTTSAGRFT